MLQYLVQRTALLPQVPQSAAPNAACAAHLCIIMTARVPESLLQKAFHFLFL